MTSTMHHKTTFSLMVGKSHALSVNSMCQSRAYFKSLERGSHQPMIAGSTNLDIVEAECLGQGTHHLSCVSQGPSQYVDSRLRPHLATTASPVHPCHFRLPEIQVAKHRSQRTNGCLSVVLWSHCERKKNPQTLCHRALPIALSL